MPDLFIVIGTLYDCRQAMSSRGLTALRGVL